jgi:general stress protein 26
MRTPDPTQRPLFAAAAIEKIRDLAESARVCLFGTSGDAFPLDVRPMAVQEVDAVGDVWFLSRRDSEKNRHIKSDPRVQLIFANPSKSEYLDLRGSAVIHDNRTLKELHWTPLAKAWFDGVDDPQLTVIQVTVLDGHYWDTEHGKAIALLTIAVRAATGKSLTEGAQGDLHP